MNQIISKALKLGIWCQLDVRFAYMLVENQLHQSNSLVLAIITLSAYVHRGHTCLPISMLTPDQLFFGFHITLANKACKKAGDLSIDCWEKLLLSSLIISNGSFLAPLVLDQKKLYLYRMWQNECLIANFFHCTSQKILKFSEKKSRQIEKLLDRFFPTINKNSQSECMRKDVSIDWQKIAIAMTLIRKIAVISGGPGTGKTSIISKLLAIFSLLEDDCPLNIKIATPTGKSAVRLNEIIHSSFKNFDIFDIFHRNRYFSVEVMTLHRLLGIYFNKNNVQRARKNFLLLDCLIIDESSMIDLSMMAKLIMMLPSRTKIIFLGDHKQLPSVEPGSVFSDICYFIGKGYTSKFSEKLRMLTNYTVPINKGNKYDIVNSLCLLKKSYRFSSVSGIGRLEYAISSGNKRMVLSLLTSNKNDGLSYIAFENDTDYSNMLVSCAFGYIEYFKNIKDYDDKDLSSVLNSFNRHRVLCALREGPFGVLELNSLIEKILNHHGFIQLIDDCQYYIGKPIIITSNAPSLPLFNGEVGVILSDKNVDGIRFFACFLSSDGSIKKVALHRLPKHETSFVMTIHKSQGSEFENTTLILPNKIVPILSRELLYTGVSRASESLSIYATDQVINYSIDNQCKRYTGLIDRLKRLQNSSCV